MSRAPFVTAKATSAYSRQVSVFDSTIGARFPNPGIEASFGADTMPETADNVAADLGIRRDASDLFAFRSQEKYEAARAGGFFDQEIDPVEIPQGRGKPPAVVSADEQGGVVTAGNASGINDGAGALLIGSQAIGERLGIRPRGRIVSAAIAGVAPRVMGLGPVPATKKALQRAGLTMAAMDVIEINEAFATQVLGCLVGLDVAPDDPRLNPNGGAIAVGHPLGASGARLTLTALRQLERIDGRYALVSMCIGVGQGIAAVVERVKT
jgi:acetyl-CoA C-acetyltransferase